jgi:hypothetical protein
MNKWGQNDFINKKDLKLLIIDNGKLARKSINSFLDWFKKRGDAPKNSFLSAGNTHMAGGGDVFPAPINDEVMAFWFARNGLVNRMV